MKLVAQRMKIEAGDHTIVSRVMLVPAEERRFKLAVELDVTLPSVDDEQADGAGPLRRTRSAPTPTRPAATSTWRSP